MTEIECQQALLENIVEEIQKSEGRTFTQSKAVRKMINIVKTFLQSKRLLCYGGTAINNILPAQDQFYDTAVEMPDYDFFSPDAIEDAKELAHIFHDKGYLNVEAKSGVHHGTYKVYVDFIAVADITQMPLRLFDNLMSDAVVIKGIHYAPPNFLRMSMYLELSRPKGMVSRWPKVFERLQLLNKYYPIVQKGKYNCFPNMAKNNAGRVKEGDDDRRMLELLLSIFLDEKVVFFGGIASLVYVKQAKNNATNASNASNALNAVKKQGLPHYDVLSSQPLKTAHKTKEILQGQGFAHVEIVKHKGIPEVIPLHYEVRVDEKSLAYIFHPLGCHSYNIVHIHGRKMRIATVNTILSFYLAFIYSQYHHFNKDRILCMAQTLFDLQRERAFQNKGLYRQYTHECYGKQKQLTNVMLEKNKKFKELRADKSSPEFQSWFLSYRLSN